ncbi:aminoglycoside phosphotransferase family protein [Kribbella sindirgiensis]|uniref:Aminoglycoside phosphotransferase family protein n=2 Tax=Kribbella sindirgiensis TaxID=1124744 RepID=A0A4R0IQC3_9ACTN|nr:aminoglycoside phosphotransferase family protein [Kribbella sindirgiensis]
MTPGVVRVADTVRRPASDSSAFTADLLRLLDERGFGAVPKYLGQDESGRDILTYLEGWVPHRYQRWSDQQVAAAGALLRAFHDATRDSPLAAGQPVVCHHDPAPTNFVFTDDLPAALFDFDLAAPGDPLEDLGYAAWTWCIASKYGDADRQAHQVRVLADGYNLPTRDRPGLLPAVLSRLLRNVGFWAQRPCPEAAERIAWSHREHAFTTANRDVFEAALTCRTPTADDRGGPLSDPLDRSEKLEHG